MKKILIAFSWIVCLSSDLLAADWPMWRGVDQNSCTSEAVHPSVDFSKIAWQKELGDGYSAVSVCKGRVLTAGNADGKDTIYCFEEKSGKEIWKFSYDCEKGKGYPGPRATPVTDGKNVYMLSRMGHLNCINFKSGKKVWSVNVMEDFETENIRWGFSGSVAIKNKNIYLNAGETGMAFDKMTGKSVWPNKGGKCGYSTPIFFTYKKKDYIAIFGAKKFFVVDEKSGMAVASYDWVTKYDINAADPIVTDKGSRIFITTGYKHGSALLAFDGTSLKKVWESNTLESQFSTPVLKDGLLYGCTGKTGKAKLVAIDHKTGELKWESEEKFGSPLLTKDKMLYIDEKGKLMLINPSAEKIEILQSKRVISNGKCWTMPVLANGLLYCRNDRGTLVCINLNGK